MKEECAFEDIIGSPRVQEQRNSPRVVTLQRKYPFGLVENDAGDVDDESSLLSSATTETTTTSRIHFGAESCTESTQEVTQANDSTTDGTAEYTAEEAEEVEDEKEDYEFDVYDRRKEIESAVKIWAGEESRGSLGHFAVCGPFASGR